jgi:hypothetical protein
MSLLHRLPILLVVTLLLTACGNDDDEPLAQESPTPTVTATPEATATPDAPEPTPTPEETATEEPAEGQDEDPADAADQAEGQGDDDDGVEPIGEFGTRTVETDDFPMGGGNIAQLVDVRVAAQDGFDRVVLEFDGTDVPSHRITFLEPPIQQDGSGNPVEIDGEAFLELRMTPASGVDLSGEAFEETYTGPDRVTAGGTSTVTEVVRTGDFEANLAWVIGMDREAPFAVEWLRDPLRLVVDVEAR